MQLVEHPPPCPHGHPYRPEQVVVGWEPCLCTPGHTGHRSYWCREDDVVQLVPTCRRAEVGTPEVLGLARPESKWHELDSTRDQGAAPGGSTKQASVVGAIVAINAIRQTCTVDTGQRQIVCRYDMSVAKMIRAGLADEETLLPKVAISGTAVLRRGGRIDTFQRVTQVARAGGEAQEVIMNKLRLLRDLPDGWAGPGSVRVDERSIERFEEFLRVLGSRVTDELEPIGLADGGIRLEWQRFGIDFVAEVEPHGGMYLCRLPADPRGDLDESREGPFDALLLAQFFREGELEDA